MRIVQHGNVFKIQEQKFNLCSREPYWKTLKYKTNSENGENEFEYEFNSEKEAEEFIKKYKSQNSFDSASALKL